MSQPLISVILVNYNSGQALLDCLGDLAREAERAPLEILVVDNASSDGSLGAARQAHPEHVYLENRINLGFARACNQALELAGGDFFMLLNPDTRVEDGAVFALGNYLAEHPRVGALGPKILDPGGEVQLSARSAQGPATLLFHRYSLLTRLFPDNALSRRYLLSDWNHDSHREVDWLSGAALMVRREAVKAAGPMDGGFFLFHEDVDWCKRIKESGFQVVYWPGAAIIHEIGISKDKGSFVLLRIRHRSMIRFVHKHYRGLGPLLMFADMTIGLRFGLMSALKLFRKKS